MTWGETPSMSDRRASAAGGALLVAAVSALFYYKWGGSLRALRQAARTGALAINPDLLLRGGAVVCTTHYLQRIWPALAYGILVGAVVRSTISPARVASVLGRRGPGPILAGAGLGSPLMLCSCCVTPVFTGVVERGASLGPALALMLASPGLNLAAVALTFLLLPLRLALIRLTAAFVIVLVLAPAVARYSERIPRVARPFGGAGFTRRARPEDQASPLALRRVLPQLARNIVYMTAVTVPLIVVGALLSSTLLPSAVHLGTLASFGAIVATALVATFVALPTFFEIPLAMLLLHVGATPGAVAALLVAGPIVNLPSLLVLSREAGARVAVALAAGVWLIACLAALGASP